MITAPTGFPASLLTATPAEGQALASRLTDLLLAGQPATPSMPELLRTNPTRPAPELVTAIYFHAIALANAGWRNPIPAHS